MSNITVVDGNPQLIEDLPLEYVERKGKGHPDSLMDGIAERASLELGSYYTDNFGQILHYNLDKGLIIGGSSQVSFGKGSITAPIEIIVGGRATKAFNGVQIPVDEIALKAARDYLKENTRFLDVENEVVINAMIRQGSLDLSEIFTRSVDASHLSNDTSFGLGFAPLSETEQLTLEIERFLNSPQYKKEMPMVGEDIKVMSVREQGRIDITLAIAFVAHLVPSLEDYASQKSKITSDILTLAKGKTKREVSVTINNGDFYDRKEVYLTKSGLSCEAGDDGQVGRGNRVNGLITPFRRMSLEAAAGKNSVNHVGKIYNVLAREIAMDVVKIYPSVKECNVSIVSQIGRKIDDPENLGVELKMDKGEKADAIRSKVKDIAEDALSNIEYITHELADGRYSLF
jgi:S-adenosylmethionine synthetase